MESESTSFLPLLTVVGLAFIVPLMLTRFRRLKIPIIVGEIVVGILVGRSGLHWVPTDNQMLDLLSEFGFVFLMFLAGMEVDFSSLGSTSGRRQVGRPRLGPVWLSLLSFALTLAMSGLAGLLLLRLGLVRDAPMMALILSTTSLGIVMPVLQERGLTAGRFGQTMLIAALVADFATMLLITVEVALIVKGPTLDILLISYLFVVFFLFYRLGVLSFKRFPRLRETLEELSHSTARIRIRAAFTILLFFVVLSETLGVELVLGAFMAGAVLSLLSSQQETETLHQLEAVGFGFFIPIFFIMVGAEFNLAALLRSEGSLLLLPLLLATAIVVKMVPALVFRLGFSWRETFAAGVLLSSRLSLIIAASAIGLRLDIISESVNAAVILVAITTVTVAPLIFQRLAPPAPDGDERHIVVFGAGHLGLMVADQLLRHREQVILVEDDSRHTEQAQQRMADQAEVLLAEVDSDRLRGVLDAAKTVVVTHNNSDKNWRISEYVRRQYGIDHIVALVNDPSKVADFEKLNVKAFNPALDRATLLGLLARNPTAYELLTRANEEKEIQEVVVRQSECVGKTLRQLALPGDVLVLALRREGEFLVPRGNTVLEAGDHLTLVGSVEHLDQARRIFDASGASLCSRFLYPLH